MPIRLKDIAADLDVSIVTVSKVLRNKTDISAETRERVLRRVEELGYRPNLIARGLASGRSLTVGLIVPDLTDGFFAELARSLGAALRRQGYQLLLASSDEDPAAEQHEIANLLARGVDALLIASCQANAAGVADALTGGAPCVLVDRMLPGAKANFVGTDDVLAGRIATQHLLRLGRTRIAHITGHDLSTAQDRLRGYRGALADKGIPYRKELVLQRNLHTGRADTVGVTTPRADEIGRAATDDLLALPKPPDAIFCYNDLLAVGAIRSVLAHKLRVPQDVAVIGCGNLSIGQYLEVPLTSVDQGTPQLGEKAAALALKLIDSKRKIAAKSLLVSPTIAVRASTKS